MSALAALLPDGRLHLQHGPIDCLCRAWGEDVGGAYRDAAAAFAPILGELCDELPLLRAALPGARPRGAVARAMYDACLPFSAGFITPMAAVAGAVADRVLAAMRRPGLRRAYVNNGGDIAFHLARGEHLRAGLVADLAAPALDGVFVLTDGQPARGLATSGRACKGRGGKSFSLGIADAVSVLAQDAARADAAATVIANAVNLPLHPAIRRRPARDIDAASDLGARLVTWEVGALSAAEVAAALDAGRRVADALREAGHIEAAVLALAGRSATSGIGVPLLETA